MRILIIILLLVSGCGPVPGGKLEGSLVQAPENWRELLADKAICEVESRPNKPHSIQLECFLYQEALYVQSHRWVNASWWPTTSWAKVWMSHPEVTVRIGSSLFDLRAIPVTDKAQRLTMLKLRGYDPVPEGIVLFRFDSVTEEESGEERTSK